MTLVQWLVLVVAVAVVAAAYWFLRSRADTDPWRNMDDPTGADIQSGDEPEAGEQSQGLDDDSDVVAVRTLTEDHDRDPAPDEPASAEGSAREAEADPAPREPASADSLDEAPAQTPESPGDGRSHRAAAAQSAPPGETAAPAGQAARIEPQPQIADNQEIFILHVAADDGRRFAGADVHAALAEQGLKFGLNAIYHRVANDPARPLSLYGVANMLNPGTLDPADQDHLATPGLTLFLVAPGAYPGRPLMREMMETANALAVALGGQVLDDRRAVLKAQTAQHMLDRIAELDRQATVARQRR